MKLLILTSRLPYPIERGDKLRIYHQIRHLSQRHEIVLFSLHEEAVAAEDLAELQRWCTSIHLFRIRKMGALWQMLLGLLRGWPLQVAYFFRPRLKRKLKEIIASEQPDHLYCQLLRMAPYLQGEKIPATLDYMDCFSVGMKRLQGQSRWYWKPIWAWEARQLARMESGMFASFAHHCIISEQDRDHLGGTGLAEVAVIPNGIDLDFFQPKPETTPGHELFFIGNLGYYLNVQAAQFLVQEIMPLVWEQRPQTRVLLAGARPTAEVQALSEEDRVSLQAWVPDIRDAYADGQLLVAPLFHSIGQQNKILESMAMEKACLTTPLVNRAIGAEEGETIWLADSPQTFATHILQLLADPTRLEEGGKLGRMFVEKHFGWERSVQQLEDLFTP